MASGVAAVAQDNTAKDNKTNFKRKKRHSNRLNNLLSELRRLKKSRVASVIKKRIRSFILLGKKGNDEIFKELCFCILTANYSAEGGIRIQKAIGNGFLTLKEKQLALQLRRLGYRFPNTRAHYIFLARKYKSIIKKIISGKNPREWLVKNIKGLGMKEASHFLRNTGKLDYAILDFHIIDLLEKYGIVKKPKTMSHKNYMIIEKKLERLCRKLKIKQGELDLYLWYLETGKVLK